jgi:NTE family protein
LSGSASTDSVPEVPGPQRAVVLGGGGLTGIAWTAGVLSELPFVLTGADRVIGTSAGAVLAARMLGGGDDAGLRDLATELAPARLRPTAVSRLLAAQVWPSRRHALQWLGRRAAAPTALSEPAFVDLISRAVGGSDWPAALIVVAVDALAGRPAYFTARSEVPLALAVAASCAMPGVLPPVHIEGRPFLDGGLRSPANADLATGCDRVLVLAPQGSSARVVRRPEHQVAKLRDEGAQVLLLQADLAPHASMSASALPAARQRGQRQGRAARSAVEHLWS